MATQHGRLSLSVYDDAGGGGTFLTHVNVDDTLTIAQAVTAIATLKTLYLTVGGAGIKEGQFSIVDKTLASVPVTTDRTGSGAVIDFAAGSPATTYGAFIPSFLPSLVLPNGTIDISTGAPAAFVTALIGAVLGGRYANSAYANLNSGLDGFSTNRKRVRRVRP